MRASKFSDTQKAFILEQGAYCDKSPFTQPLAMLPFQTLRRSADPAVAIQPRRLDRSA